MVTTVVAEVVVVVEEWWKVVEIGKLVCKCQVVAGAGVNGSGAGPEIATVSMGWVDLMMKRIELPRVGPTFDWRGLS